MIVKSFRGRKVPLYINTKSQLIAWALLIAKKDKQPITNGEFAFTLRCLRYGGIIHNLRQQGWVINTIQGKKRGEFSFELTYVPPVKTMRSQYALIVKKGR